MVGEIIYIYVGHTLTAFFFAFQITCIPSRYGMQLTSDCSYCIDVTGIHPIMPLCSIQGVVYYGAYYTPTSMCSLHEGCIPAMDRINGMLV